MSITLILTLISALSGSLTSLLSGDGVLSGGLASLINASIAAGVALFNALRGGGSVSSELQSALTALQSELAAVKADTSADPTVVANLAELDKLVSAAVSGFTAAEQGADPSTLPTPPPVS